MNLDTLPIGATARIAAIDWSAIPESEGHRLRSLGVDNGATVESKLRSESGALHRLLLRANDDDERIKSIYLLILARHPTSADLKLSRDYLKQVVDRREGFVDLAWALINSHEFLFNH